MCIYKFLQSITEKFANVVLLTRESMLVWRNSVGCRVCIMKSYFNAIRNKHPLECFIETLCCLAIKQFKIVLKFLLFRYQGILRVASISANSKNFQKNYKYISKSIKVL